MKQKPNCLSFSPLILNLSFSSHFTGLFSLNHSTLRTSHFFTSFPSHIHLILRSFSSFLTLIQISSTSSFAIPHHISISFNKKILLSHLIGDWIIRRRTIRHRTIRRRPFVLWTIRYTTFRRMTIRRTDN